jgi:TolA-binding protein
MDENKDRPENEIPPPETQDDAQQFRQWMAQYGRPALIGLAVAVVALLGVSIWRGQQTDKAAAAVQALFQARSPEEFQQMAVVNPEAPTAPLALATAAAEFYAQGRYDEALAAYQSFLEKHPGHMLAPDAQVGAAASLEAMDDFMSAAERYEAFAEAHPASALLPQAVMGAARCREQLGQFEEARALYEDFIVAHADSPWLPQAESGLLFLKKAERAKNAPPRAAPADRTIATPPVFVAAEEFPGLTVVGGEAEAGVEAAPAAEEPAPKKKASKKKAAKAAEAAVEPAPVAEEAPAIEAAAGEEPEPKKKATKKKQAAAAAD